MASSSSVVSVRQTSSYDIFEKVSARVGHDAHQGKDRRRSQGSRVVEEHAAVSESDGETEEEGKNFLFSVITCTEKEREEETENP